MSVSMWYAHDDTDVLWNEGEVSEPATRLQLSFHDLGEDENDERDDGYRERERMRMADILERPEEFIDRVVDMRGNVSESE